METYSTTDIIKILNEKNLTLFSLADFERLFRLKKRNTLYKKILRLEKKGIIQKLIKGKYRFLLNSTNDFNLANFIYQPSYVSLESALSFYGIVAGFPHRITSLTVKKSRMFIIDNKEYLYSKISSKLFWGYEKKENFLIAEKEKALIDYLYFCQKGLRSLDREDLDLSEIDKSIAISYGRKFKNNKLLALSKSLIR